MIIGVILLVVGIAISGLGEAMLIPASVLVMIGMVILMLSTVIFLTTRSNQIFFKKFSAKNTNSKSRFQVPNKVIIIGVVIGISLCVIGGIYASTAETIEVPYIDEDGNNYGSYYTIKDEGDTMIILSLILPGVFIIIGVTIVPMMSWSMRVGAEFWGFDSKKDKE